MTGASSGIGWATSLRLLREGMRVAACARREARLLSLREAAGADAERLVTHAFDVRDEGAIVAAFAAVRAAWGGVDVLVNNAGLGHAAPLCDAPTELWREMLEVNVLALAVCTREALCDMRARGDRGHVVHVSSMSAHRVPEQSGMYAASKFAVRALTEALRLELRAARSRIRVTAVSPGYVETEFAGHYHQSEEAAKRTYGRFPVMQPDDVADLVVFALSRPPHVEVHDLLVRPTAQPY
ncbi:MAG: SDR family NAD(P)-dependent oxidoreductase [Myxococcales bacterium]|nr:SDR family NAD(P)-dependent oxidoreductase [Myxococcales bacterium]